MKDNLLKKQSEEDWVDSTLLAKNGAGGRNLMFASMERNIKKKNKTDNRSSGLASEVSRSKKDAVCRRAGQRLGSGV